MPSSLDSDEEMSERSEEDMAFLIRGCFMSAKRTPTFGWKSVKLDERTTGYGSALFV